MNCNGAVLVKEPVIFQFNSLPQVRAKTKNELKKEFLSLIQKSYLAPSKVAKHLAIPQRLANYWLNGPKKSAAKVQTIVKQKKLSENAYLTFPDLVYRDITIPLDKSELRLKRNDFSTLEERYQWASYWLNYCGINYSTNCLFIGYTHFYNSKNDNGILAMCAFTAHGIVKVDVIKNKTIEQDQVNFKRFVQLILEMMDKDDKLKTHYVVTQHDFILNQIYRRGYQCICLPPFSPDLNPMEQYWSACQNQLVDLLLRSGFISNMIDICYQIRLIDLQCFCQYSFSIFENCINKIPI